MIVVINGDKKRIQENLNVQELIAEFGLKPETTVVEKNGRIIERALFSREKISGGDVIEIVRFVGGG